MLETTKKHLRLSANLPECCLHCLSIIGALGEVEPETRVAAISAVARQYHAYTGKDLAQLCLGDLLAVLLSDDLINYDEMHVRSILYIQYVIRMLCA